MAANRPFRFVFLLALAPAVLLISGPSDVHSAARPGQIYSNGAHRQYMWATSAWAPDHKTLAQIEVAPLIGTPEGANSCLYLNSHAVYPAARPKDCEPHPRDIYDGLHTFLTPPVWSPDSRKVAIVVRIFDWEYEDPFGKYWEGSLTNDRYFLVIASLDQPTAGYSLKSSLNDPPHLEWLDNDRLTLEDQMFDLAAQPPAPIP